jgi:hypothetical protein
MGKNAKKSREKKLARGRHRVHQNATADGAVQYAARGNHQPMLLTPVRSPVKGVKNVVSATTCVRVKDSAVHGEGLFATVSIDAGTDLLLEFELSPPKKIAWRYQQLKEQEMISGNYDRQVPTVVYILMLPDSERCSVLAYYHSCACMPVHPLIIEQVINMHVQRVCEYANCVHRPSICSRVWVPLYLLSRCLKKPRCVLQPT